MFYLRVLSPRFTAVFTPAICRDIHRYVSISLLNSLSPVLIEDIEDCWYGHCMGYGRIGVWSVRKQLQRILTSDPQFVKHGF